MSEKRYFNIFSQKHVIGGSNEYMKLYNYICNHKDIKIAKLEKQSFVKNLSAEKNYLYSLILKSLNSFHNDSTEQIKIRQLLTNAEILLHKGLDQQALQLAKKAEKIAEKCDLFSLQLVIKEFELEVLSKILEYDKAIEKQEDIAGILEKFNNLNEIQLSATKIYQKKTRIGKLRTKEDEQSFKELFNDKMIQPENAFSKKALLFQTSLRASFSQGLKDHKSSIPLIEKIIELYENNNYLMQYSTSGYIASIYNLANIHIQLNDYKKSMIVIEKLASLSDLKQVKNSLRLSARVFYFYNNLILYVKMQLQEYKEVLSIINSIKSEYEKHHNQVSKNLLYDHYLLLIKAHFLAKEFKQALFYSNEIINDLQYKTREDLLTLVRLMNLLIHFELNNEFSIDYLASSSLNYLKKKDRLFGTEKALLKFFNSYFKKTDDIGKSKSIIKLSETLKELKSDKNEAKMFTYFDFESWASEQSLKK